MKRFVYTEMGERLLRIEEAEPVCGVDYCDDCGDCLVCSGGAPCGRDGEAGHIWVVYEAEEE